MFSSALIPPCMPDDDQPAVRREGGDVACQIRGAHDVEDRRRRPAVGGRADPCDEILRPVVDGDVRTEVAAAASASYASPPSPRPARRAPAPPGSPCVPIPLPPPCISSDCPACRLARHHQVRPHRAGHLRQRRRRVTGRARRDRQYLRRRHRPPVRRSRRPPAARTPRRPSASRVTRADLRDHAGALQPEDLRRAGRRRVEPAPLQQVGAVHGASQRRR